MRRIVAIAIVAAVLLPLLGMTWLIAPRAEVQAQAGEIEIVGALINPGFEGIFLPQDGQGPLQLAKAWKARWVEGRQGKPGIGVAGGAAENTDFRRPEWKEATIQFPYRVRTGERAQQWFSYSGIHYAGIYQNAIVTAGDTIVFSVYGQGWAGQSNDPLTDGEIFVSLGVDPECKEWLESRSVVWTAWQWIPNAKSQNASLDNWTLFKSYPVKMLRSCATVWIVTTAKWATQHNDAYFDDAKMWRVTQGGDCPACPTPVVCPVLTPCAPCPTPGPGGTVLCSCSCQVQ